jgi:hypothetical protein
MMGEENICRIKKKRKEKTIDKRAVELKKIIN